MLRLPFAEWLPDQPALGGGGEALGVVPGIGGYRPMPQLSSVASALAARVQGAVAVKDRSGNVNIFAGTGTKLYRLTSGTTFSDASIVANYTTAADDLWTFTQFGERVIATNYTDNVQSYVIGTSALFADLAAAAPKAKYVAVIRDFVALAHTNDGTFGIQPQRIWWSAINDPTSWPTPGGASAIAAQSDYQDLVGDGGHITGIVTGLTACDAVIMQERAMWQMRHIGDATIFRFDRMEGSRGCLAPGSLVSNGNMFWFLSADGFYMSDGVQSVPIGAEKVDRWFFSEADPSYYQRITAAVDPINKLVMWSFAGQNNSSGGHNRLIIYNWQTQKWSHANVDVDLIFRALSIGLSLDDLDSISSSVDALAFSLDSRVWAGGKLVLAAFDNSHRLSYFQGSAMSARLETTEGQFSDSRRTLITEVWPLIDGATCSIAVGYRNRQSDAVTWGSDVAQNAIGFSPQRRDTRFARARVSLSASSSWTHAIGVEINGVRTGAR